MDERITYWASVGLGALALFLLILNISLIDGNRRMQNDVAQRQLAINRGVSLSQINQNLVQALADVAVRGGDTDVRDLLSAQGITVKAAPKADDKTKK